MLDKLVATCVRCNKTFDVLVGRGEIVPALCVQCWWIDAEERAELAEIEAHKRGRTPFPDDVAGADQPGAQDGDGQVIDVKEV